MSFDLLPSQLSRPSLKQILRFQLLIFVFFWPLQSNPLIYWHGINTDSLFCPWGKKTITFSLHSTRLIRALSMTPLVSVLTGRALTLLGYNPRLERNIVDGIIKGHKSNQPPPSPAPCSPEINSQTARRPKRAIFPPLVRESGLRNPASFGCGILNPGLRNPEYSSRIPESNNDRGLESSLHWQRIQNPAPGNPESTAWNPESKTVLDSLTWREFFTHLFFCHLCGIVARILQKFC